MSETQLRHTFQDIAKIPWRLLCMSYGTSTSLQNRKKNTRVSQDFHQRGPPVKAQPTSFDQGLSEVKPDAIGENQPAHFYMNRIGIT